MLTGTLDSGADRHDLSIKAAENSGSPSRTFVRPIRSRSPTTATSRSWITHVPIRAQVQIHLPDTHDLVPWGPLFDLHPVFMETGSPLWGQEDFCASFKVNLERYSLPAHFVLGDWAGMSDGVRDPHPGTPTRTYSHHTSTL